MATIALQAAGNALLPGFGGILGAFVGRWVDENFLLPALFPRDDIQGPRLDSLQLSYASEGAPVNICFGPECLVQGTVVWMSPIREVKSEEQVGGKGGGGQTVVNFEYFADFAVLIADGSHLDDGYNGGDAATMVARVIVNGNLFYDRDIDVAFSDSASRLSVTRLEYRELPSAPTLVTRVEMELKSLSGGPDLTALRSGRVATLAGFTRANNNGTFKVRATREDTLTGDTYATLRNDDCETEAASAAVRTITQDNNEFAPGAADSITFYPGSFSQTADPTIVAVDGAANTPAYRGSAMMVVKNMALNPLGQRPPSTWEVLLQAQASISVREVMRQLLTRAGREEGVDFDVSAVSDTTLVRGFIVRGPRRTAEALEQLMIAYGVLHQERAGVMTFFDRASADTLMVRTQDMATHARGSDSPRTVRWRPGPALDLPKELTVSYVDPMADYQAGAQKFKRLKAPVGLAGTQTLTLRLDLVLEAVDAMCIAKRELWSAWLNRSKAAVVLTPRYLAAVENDRLLIVDDEGEQRTLLVDSVDRGANEARAYDCMEEATATLDFDESDCPVEDPEIPTQVVYTPPEIVLHVLDVAPLRDEDATRGTLLWLVAAADRTALFIGATLFESLDSGATYGFKDSTNKETTLGVGQAALAAPAEAGTWDRSSEVKVRLTHGDGFESRDEQAVLNGANLLLVGDEFVGFATASYDSGTDVWTLTDLVRGQRGTEDQVGVHAPNDRVILMSDGTPRAVAMNLSARGTTRLYKGVPTEGLEADFDAVELEVQLNSLRPFSPAYARGSRNGSNDLIGTFERRTRLLYTTFSGSPPQEDTVLAFEVDVLDSPGGAVLRTITQAPSANGSAVDPDPDGPSFTYDAADIAADGLTPGDPVDVEIFQVSQSVGRSKPLAATI